MKARVSPWMSSHSIVTEAASASGICGEFDRPAILCVRCGNISAEETTRRGEIWCQSQKPRHKQGTPLTLSRIIRNVSRERGADGPVYCSSPEIRGNNSGRSWSCSNDIRFKHNLQIHLFPICRGALGDLVPERWLRDKFSRNLVAEAVQPGQRYKWLARGGIKSARDDGVIAGLWFRIGAWQHPGALRIKRVPNARGLFVRDAPVEGEAQPGDVLLGPGI